MPDFVSCTITAQPEVLQALKGDRVIDFNAVIPLPSDLDANAQMDWASCNWNTKWNACDPEIHSPSCASFDCAWTTPDPIFQKLSLLTNSTIDMLWRHEDGTKGRTIYADGLETTTILEQGGYWR